MPGRITYRIINRHGWEVCRVEVEFCVPETMGQPSNHLGHSRRRYDRNLEPGHRCRGDVVAGVI